MVENRRGEGISSPHQKKLKLNFLKMFENTHGNYLQIK
jgi:hypothetical protein